MIKILTKDNSNLFKSANSICYNYFGDISSDNQNNILFGSLIAFNLYFVKPKYTKVSPRKKNAEIITFPLLGYLHHLNSVAINNLLSANSIQRLTCGNGLSFTNENISDSESVFLEMEFFAKESNQSPSYEYYHFKLKENDFTKIASDLASDKVLFVNTRANFYILSYEENKNIIENLNSNSKYIYFIVSGEICINDEKINEHSLIKLDNYNKLEIHTYTKTKLLKVELPYLFI